MVNIANDHGTSAPANPLAATEQPEQGARHSVAVPETVFSMTGRTATATRYLLAGIRLALGWVFLWAFLDKLFDLGRGTVAANAWLDGGSPTVGLLGKAATGPFAGFYHSIAGNAVVDVLFMTGLLGIGVALMLGIGMRIAAAGALLTVLMWTAVLPPDTNPFMDDHLVYAAVLVLLALLGTGTTWGFGRQWAGLPLVRRNTWLT